MSTLRTRPYLVFFALAIFLFIIATLGSDVVARTTVGGDSFGKAISDHVYYAVIQPIGTTMLLAPFLLLGWMAASAAKRKGFDAGLGVFLLGMLLLGFMYFSGYQDSQGFMKERKWTAATLSIGLLPFKSIPLLLICLGLRWLVVRKKDEAKT
jgi:phosphotransferase system  glucose/maltose/N-acetylglucosamine-specific IIC component